MRSTQPSTAAPDEGRQPPQPFRAGTSPRRAPLGVHAPKLASLTGTEHTQALRALSRLLPEPDTAETLPAPVVPATLDTPERGAASAA